MKYKGHYATKTEVRVFARPGGPAIQVVRAYAIGGLYPKAAATAPLLTTQRAVRDWIIYQFAAVRPQ